VTDASGAKDAQKAARAGLEMSAVCGEAGSSLKIRSGRLRRARFPAVCRDRTDVGAGAAEASAGGADA